LVDVTARLYPDAGCGCPKGDPLMVDGNLTKDRIIRLIRESKTRLNSLGVESIGLFGSFAKGNASPQSDVDILVGFDPGKKTYDNFIDICFLLEELFGRKVELVTTESISPYIGPYILKEVEYVPLTS
jgi:predicted nucleotidyltransferase